MFPILILKWVEGTVSSTWEHGGILKYTDHGDTNGVYHRTSSMAVDYSLENGYLQISISETPE